MDSERNFKKKIAICIVTYNRAFVLKDICLKFANVRNVELFDLYIYDSSSNDEAKEQIKEILKNHTNFFYEKLPESIHSSKKLYDIYSNKFIQTGYEYLWIMPDYLFFIESVWEKIWKKLDNKWDMIMLDFYDVNKKGDRQYSEPNDIFYNFAWSMTQYGIMIINCDTVLKSVNWEDLGEKYLTQKYRNFSHVIMYFEIMLKIPNLRFFHFSISSQDVYRSRYKTGSSYLNEYLYIWGYCWYESINVLPMNYTNKSKVIKDACIYTKNLGRDILMQLRVNKVLTKEEFNKYKFIWKYVSTVNRATVWCILHTPIFVIEKIIEYGSIKNWILFVITIFRLKLFCKLHKKIFLYGAGGQAEKYAEILEKYKIPFCGFVVTDINANKHFLKNHQVFELSRLEIEYGMGIILALNKKNRREVIPILHSRKIRTVFKSNII